MHVPAYVYCPCKSWWWLFVPPAISNYTFCLQIICNWKASCFFICGLNFLIRASASKGKSLKILFGWVIIYLAKKRMWYVSSLIIFPTAGPVWTSELRIRCLRICAPLAHPHTSRSGVNVPSSALSARPPACTHFPPPPRIQIDKLKKIPGHVKAAVLFRHTSHSDSSQPWAVTVTFSFVFVGRISDQHLRF